MDVRVGLWRKLSAKELMLLNCGVGEDSWESHDCKEIQPVHSEGDHPWDFLGRNDAKAETPVLWPPHVKNWLIGKDPDAGRDWWQEEKGTTEDMMAGWHHRLDGREFEWSPGVGDGQGGLACCDSWGRKESDTTERLNWTELMLRWLLYHTLNHCREKWTSLEALYSISRMTDIFFPSDTFFSSLFLYNSSNLVPLTKIELFLKYIYIQTYILLYLVFPN